MRLFSKVIVAPVALACAVPSLALAQRPDSTRAAVPTVTLTAAQVDTLKAPMSPRRAFFYSFLAPGYSQSVLGRHKAAVGFMLVEAISVVMIRESGADKHEARRLANDTVIVSYVDASGNAATTTAPPHFNDTYVRTRAAHVEDWAALLVANHLIAGADAYVSANLWDVGARLGLRVLPTGTMLVASFTW
jgi:hypothetical protein